MDEVQHNPLDAIWAWEESGPLGSAVEPIDRVGRLAELIRSAQGELEAEVRKSIAAGSSWSDVGAQLGISKQTAHARYGESPAKIASPAGMPNAPRMVRSIGGLPRSPGR